MSLIRFHSYAVSQAYFTQSFAYLARSYAYTYFVLTFTFIFGNDNAPHTFHSENSLWFFFVRARKKRNQSVEWLCVVRCRRQYEKALSRRWDDGGLWFYVYSFSFFARIFLMNKFYLRVQYCVCEYHFCNTAWNMICCDFKLINFRRRCEKIENRTGRE